MKYLLDTHILIWSLENNPSLSNTDREAIEDASNTVLVSTASFFEMAIKISIGKLQPPLGLSFADLQTHLEARAVQILRVEASHTDVLKGLPFHHRDPFDRMLVAQAMVERATLLTNDDLLKPYFGTNL